jgi:signal transduction histidine kinase
MLPGGRQRRWRHHARHAISHSLQWRLVILFLLLALAMTGTFIYGMQKALSVGWRDAAKPLVTDYVNRLVAEIGSPPDVQRAMALTQRLPVRVRISGPVVNWQSDAGTPGSDAAWRDRHFSQDSDLPLLQRMTSDGHRIQLGLSVQAWQDRPRQVGWLTLAGLLLLTALAHAYTRRLLRPLDDIRAGARRFGAGDFAGPIPIRRRDELGQLATDVNAMASSLHQMLEAKRGLLLSISHELRSPLTRARLNTELLPETADVQVQRQALLRDLGEMRDLVTDLLESERLGQGHAALHLESTDPGALAREVVESMALGHEGALDVQVVAEDGLPALRLDRTRMRLLVRNLLDNALRHSAGVAQPPRLTLHREGRGVCLSVRDFGPGVDKASLPRLAEPFYRPDVARERATGGVGLGLHLCKLVALAHGGSFEVRNAQPGLAVTVVLPA